MEPLQIVWGIAVMLFSLFVPGYFLTLGFFPRKAEIGRLERFVFSFVFSVTFLPLIVLVENQLFKWPISAISAGFNILALIAFGWALWFARTRKLKKKEAVPLLPFKRFG